MQLITWRRWAARTASISRGADHARDLRLARRLGTVGRAFLHRFRLRRLPDLRGLPVCCLDPQSLERELEPSRFANTRLRALGLFG